MDENQKWQMQLVKEIATIKADVKHIKYNIPICEKKLVFNKIKNTDLKIGFNRKLFFLILISYVPLMLTLIFKLVIK